MTEEDIINKIEWANKRSSLQGQPFTETQINYLKFVFANKPNKNNCDLYNVSQQRELLPLFDDRHLNNGIAFTLTESGKLGKHPESKLVYETTIKLKKWILDNFELKKR